MHAFQNEWMKELRDAISSWNINNTVGIEINKIMMISKRNFENQILLKAHTLHVCMCGVWTHATFYFHIKCSKLVPFLVSKKEEKIIFEISYFSNAIHSAG